ncbi:TerB family tellurite resistance protein [Sagittula sp. NFXS13]|uniref:Putative tellurite resistance protein B-like protein n=1 Tax=Sagittula marina TaxID=943940 RepID=A0A7W6DL27_9RHOB|nr:TerB family tellurite resistance protein [Sagittula marina]MBB3984534.1 putative tellurite resistance protein B-like protein [Sagittula marina]
MFERLTHFFANKAPKQAPLPAMDAKHALGTLLVRVAQIDRAYLFEEIEQIDRILAEWNDINPVEAAKMRAMCERLSESAGESEELADLIREHVDYAHRLEAAQAMWKVALADGITDQQEEALIDLIENHLSVESMDSEAARASAVIS